VSEKLKYCLKCGAKLDYINQHPEAQKIRWKLMGFDDPTSAARVKRTEAEIKDLKDELNDETKKVRFFSCSNPKCDFLVRDDGLGYQAVRQKDFRKRFY
jgi:hypothetical protein